MQLQCRSRSTCAAGFSIANRVKIIVEGQTLYISFNTSYLSLILTKLMFFVTHGQPSRKATTGAGKN